MLLKISNVVTQHKSIQEGVQAVSSIEDEMP